MTTKKFYIFVSFLITLWLLGGVFSQGPVLAQTVTEQITDRKQRIDEINKQIAEYQDKIRQKQAESVSLKNELNILGSQISKTQLEIKAKQEQVQQTQLEIQQLQLQLEQKNLEISKNKEDLANFLRLIFKYQEQGTLAVFFSQNNFSDFFDQLKFSQNFQSKLQQDLQSLEELKKNLAAKQADLQGHKISLEKISDKLEENKAVLDNQKGAKSTLMSKAKNSEKEFQKLVTQLKAEQAQISAEITSLEKKARQNLTSQQAKQIQALGNVLLQWPVPSHTVTAYFHDPDYPFRYVYEHPAVDIRAAQGTAITAAEAGYIGTAKNAGLGYSYIMIIHNEQISTVYGHVSKILVSEDEFVKKGQVIALSGGSPGTPGAGRMTFGPHLHFEVRYNGIPVNPLDYLP
ncbi:MAG: peptidoglycan DD-metalloendopeptidase family protein [Candidatus Buchananbacteria bacterium]